MNDSIAIFYSKCSEEFDVGFTVVTSLLMVAAVVVNIMIFVAVYTTQNLKTSANYYIVNMAVSDLLFVIVVGSWGTLYSLSDLKMFAFIEMSVMSFLCKLVFFVGNFSCTVSVASLVLITVDRFIACVYPLKMKLITAKFRRIVLFLTWIIAVPLNFYLFYYSSLVHSNGRAVCLLEINDLAVIQFYVDFTLLYCVPLITVTVLYYYITKSLRQAGPRANLQGCVNIRRQKQNKKTLAISISIVSACFIYWTPYILLGFLVIFKPSLLTGSECKILVILSNLFFPLVSTVINPVILFLFGTNYRAALSSCFNCPCKSSRNRAH